MHRPLLDELRRRRPDLTDPGRAIEAGHVVVDGVIVTNPRSRVRPDASITLRPPSELRGSTKLRAALDRFGVAVSNRVCLDVGAAAGGFTSVLLEQGAARVYAVDVGYGQLLGRLRQHPRVVNLERTNLADLDGDLVAEPIGLVTIDVSYLSVAEAVPQLDRVALAPRAELVALVKPMFELKLAAAPSDPGALHRALVRAVDAVTAAGWVVMDTMDSPHTGAKGVPELFLHARRGS